VGKQTFVRDLVEMMAERGRAGTNRSPSGFFHRRPRRGKRAAAVTRDGGRYRTYFPRMALIAPEK